MYWTLPARSIYGEEKQKNHGGGSDRQRSPDSKDHYNAKANRSLSSHQPGAMESSHGLSSLKLVQNVRKNEFTSSTPTKEPLHNSNTLNLADGVSPILKENIFNSKSKMTAEEIFAAIHKSKKKLNIKDDAENRSESPSSSSLSPDGSEKSLPCRSRERSSWSPNTSDTDLKRNEARSRRSWIGGSTPINSFKKLLLQQGSKNSPSKDFRISAVEQLKLSKQVNRKSSDDNSRNNVMSRSGGVGRQEAKTPPRTMLNNRSRHQWRFASPRTDVLSSTIPEDCSEVEKSEDASTMPEELEKSSPRFVRSEGLDRDNLHNSTDFRESRNEINKPKENKSLEITKKYLQQARKNFFSEPVSPITVGLPSPPSRKQLDFSRDGTSLILPNSSNISSGSPQNYSVKNYVTSNEKRKSPIISLETAL